MEGRNFEMQALDIESRDFWVLSLERLKEKIQKEEQEREQMEQEAKDQIKEPQDTKEKL